jgi:AcrR family transcriptional regulator
MTSAVADSATPPPAKRRRGRPTTRRDHLLDTALRLFGRDGFHAVGIDRILAESGVAKMTLYKHFPSKQALIVAALERKDASLLAWLESGLARRGEGPREQLLAVFDLLGEWFGGADFHGCLFIKAAGEYPDLADPVHQAAAAYKRRLLGLLTGLASEAGAPSPRLLAQRLLLLVEGATVVAQVLGGREAARQARDTAALIVRQMLGQAA